MMKVKNVFAVSFIAMFAVGAAHATMVSKTMLNTELAKKQDTIAANTYDAYGAATNAKNAIEDKLDNGASGYDIDAKSLKVQGTSVLTSHQDISGKLNIAQGSSAASKAVITNSSGSITTGTIATGMITDGAVTAAKIADGTITSTDISSSAGITKSQLATAVQTSLGKADSALQSHQDISGKLNIAQGSSAASKAVITNSSGSITTGTIATGMITNNAVTDAKINNFTKSTATDTLTAAKTTPASYDAHVPSLGAVAKMINDSVTEYDGVVSGVIGGKQDTLNSGTGGNVTIASNNASASGVVKQITATDGEVTVTRGTIATGDITDSAVTSAKIANGTIVDADISSTAAITQSKINGLTTALAQAQNTIPTTEQTGSAPSGYAFIWVE